MQDIDNTPLARCIHQYSLIAKIQSFSDSTKTFYIKLSLLHKPSAHNPC